MNGVFLDEQSLNRGDLDLGALTATGLTWRFWGETRPEAAASRIRTAQVVVTNKVPLTASVLEQAEQLRLVCVAATGTNNVDLEAARLRGVAVCNVRGYATAAVTQHVFALMLALATRLPDYLTAVREGAWQRSTQFCLLDYPIGELNGKVLGIVGYGELGRSVARVAKAFGMRVRVAARPGTAPVGERTALAELLPKLDLLTLHCPLTPQTRGLIGPDELARLKPGAIVINTARGGIVDEQALADALRAGRLGGAGVDVLAVEPPVDGSPLLAGDIPNLLVTPHVAWASREARQRLVEEIGANIHAFLADQSRNRVV